MDFQLYQMDVKIALLNGHNTDEVYFAQPSSFENHEFSNWFKLSNALLWVETSTKSMVQEASKFLNDNSFSRGKIDNTLFTKIKNH